MIVSIAVITYLVRYSAGLLAHYLVGPLEALMADHWVVHWVLHLDFRWVDCSVDRKDSKTENCWVVQKVDLKVFHWVDHWVDHSVDHSVRW